MAFYFFFFFLFFIFYFFYRVAIFDKDKGGHAIISFVAIKTLFFLKRKKK
jgi:hypothetical protein